MDVWIAAVAVGTGYLAHRLKGRIISRHNASSDNIHLIRTELTMKAQKVQFEEEICEQIEYSYHDASTSGFKGDDLIQLDSLESWGLVSDSNSLAGFKGEDVQGDWEGRICFNTNEVIMIDSVSQPSLTEVRFSHDYRLDRSRIGIPQINGKFIKPQTSLESCLMAQLYKERVEIEECTCSIHPSQKPTFTDGNLIINRAPQQSCIELYRTREYKLSKDTHLQDKRTSFEVPRLPCVVAVDLQMEAIAKTGKEPVSPRGNASKVICDNQSNAQGSLNSTIIFFLGLTMGIVHSLLGHQREIDNLRKSLKQTENLVQDLHEELEMKDGLTVNELSIEDYESPVHKDTYIDDANHAMPMLSLEQKLDSSSTYCDDENNDQNTKEESLRKIEAELEAELDRLESNMKSSGLEGKISDLSELDPDFVPSAIKGELRADLFDLFEEETPDYAEEDERRNSVPQSARYPVSPRDLSLRLHEVIHSRLEERVKELETALEYSERKIKCMESDHNLPCREVSVLKTGSWSNLESPDATDQPTVINLSGEALAAYNEAYDAFPKVSESDEAESNHSHHEIFHPLRHDLENGCMNSSYMKQQYLGLNGSREMAFDRDDADNVESNDVICSSRDESIDGEDEMERLLIRQIVEKARQGSPAVLKAQRVFLSTHEY